MGAPRQIEDHGCFGGRQQVFAHDSEALGCEARFAVYLPPRALAGEPCPTLLFLSGLTCTEQNVITKSGIQAACAARGLILLAPDTSPRGAHVPDDAAWDLGQGAGFYLDAARAPWARHFRMERYMIQELLPMRHLFTSHPAVGVTGHSMGGHGALVLALRHPEVFGSVSALAPILQPSDTPWGQKAFSAYLGEDRSLWAAHDARSLVAGATRPRAVLIDQGAEDPFLAEQLPAEGFLAAASASAWRVTYRLQPGYDHGYYFVSSFIADHVAHAAEQLA